MVEVLWIMTRIYEGLNNNDSGYTIMKNNTFSYPLFSVHMMHLYSLKCQFLIKHVVIYFFFFYWCRLGWVGIGHFCLVYFV